MAGAGGEGEQGVAAGAGGGKNGLYNDAPGACDVVMGQTMMGINADRAYTFTFTDMTGDWGQFFVDAIASITPVAQ